MPKFSAPTVSKHRAMPVVQTKLALMPCSALATSSMEIVDPTSSRTVAASNAAMPNRNGARLVRSLSVMIPAIGAIATEAPAYAERRLETLSWIWSGGRPI